MASMRDIKRRRSSIQSTQQITKAMKLISTVKLQKAKQGAENSKPYFECMLKTVTSMLEKAGEVDHPYLKGKEGGKTAIVAITSNRGLAGGYNSNIVKLIDSSGIDKENVVLYTIGRKGADLLKRRGYEIAQDYSDVIEAPTYSDAQQISRQLLTDFASGEISEIYIAYTKFKNTVVHVPMLTKLLPMSIEEGEKEEEAAVAEEETADARLDRLTLMNFEPEEEEALGLIVPKYITSIIYGAFAEAVASENGARMTAMDSATNNAEEMINDLGLKYNRARQSSITQELTEIIAGANAVG